jgi:hypothetical protein
MNRFAGPFAGSDLGSNSLYIGWSDFHSSLDRGPIALKIAHGRVSKISSIPKIGGRLKKTRYEPWSTPNLEGEGKGM